MPIYRTTAKKFFISEVTEFIFTNFENHFDNLKIILPNGYLCNYLQKNIVSKVGTTILPSIIPINDISSSLEDSFQIPFQQIGKITSLEERIILTEIINSYDKLNYTIPQTISLASSLAKLFFEFEANKIEFNKLKNIPTLDQAEHWHFIYDFLEFAYKNWQEKIVALKKSTPAQHQKLIFNAELNRIQEAKNYTVIAGVIGNNQITKDFIVEISKLKNGYIILPPFVIPDQSELTKLLPEEPLYNIGKLLKQLAVGLQNVPYLGKISTTSILDNLLIKNISTNYLDNIKYVEFDNIFLEAEYVAAKCHETVLGNSDTKIAVLISDDKIKNYFIAKFDKYGLNFSDLLGENLLNLPLTGLVLEIAKNICQEFFLPDFISLILHPLIICDETKKLKRLIAKHNRFSQNINDITKIIDDNFTDRSHLDNLHNICRVFRQKIISHNFGNFLNQTIDAVKIIYPNLWQGFYNNKIINAFTEIIQVTKDIELSDPENFPDILKELISGGRIYNDPSNRSIIICSPNEATLINYDLIIHTNFALNSYPPPQIGSPWLNKQMIEQIGLDSWTARFGNSMYDFYLNLHNKNVLITRSIKTGNSSASMPSPFLLTLKHILKNNLNQTFIPADSTINNLNQQTVEYVFAQNFPKQISATDIETLIRAPYNFYAKKILNLKIEQEIEETPGLSEFGNFFHKVVEIYTKNYTSDPLIALERFKNYAKELLLTSIFPKQTTNFWQAKIEAIAKDFILFDHTRRQNLQQVVAEARGELVLKISGKEIKIVAIADRIEINKENKAIIMDYKTGTLPTKKDVFSGLSPQLIIESIILLEGGFGKLGSLEVESLVYVKINSKSPYISLIEIPIRKEDIQNHKQGLINLLTHYITTGQYFLEPNLMNYDDYWHLARRS
ncbi:MAG: PD-(D/E)XK nuclease family protein [Rickettsiaceae bacterium]|nr:PD-(D/E)XK nuclease family protein [Rickettsiaceae bacterium]